MCDAILYWQYTYELHKAKPAHCERALRITTCDHDLVKRSTEWIHWMYHNPTATMPVSPVARNGAVDEKKKSSPNSSASVHIVPNSRIAYELDMTFGQTNLTRLFFWDSTGATTAWSGCEWGRGRVRCG